MCSFKEILSLALVASLPMLQGVAQAASYVDVLELPAKSSALALNSPLLDIASAGQRLITVGQRGHILYSDDVGQNWQQAQVPVSVDLNAVHFPTPELGWAVGNDGVILHSRDAGKTWSKQLDGRAIGNLLVRHYGALASAEPDNAQWPLLVAEGERLATEGADKPFLDVWFENDQLGYVVGVFNLILRTSDGGKTWQPFQDRVDNPKGFHLNAIASTGDALYIAGEQGLLLKWDAGPGRFTALQIPYQGTYFGVIGKPGEVIAFGLRGHAFRSADGGGSWQQLDSGLQTSLTAAALDGSDRYRLFTQGGHMLAEQPGAAQLQLMPQQSQSPVAGAIVAGNKWVLVGSRGVRTLAVE